MPQDQSPWYRMNPGLRATREGDFLRLETAESELVCPPDVFGVLQHFCQPRSLSDIPTTAASVVAALVKNGALVPVHRDAPLLQEAEFDSPQIHTRMLSDVERTRAYLDAINAVIQPGDVVLDLGSGTGVLAVAAAQSGARRVFAIEAGAVGRLAEQMAAQNGVADRVDVIRGWSTSITLPERCDVLVSETIGDEPLGERVLENLLDAKRRLLVPSPRLIPRTLAIRVTLCEAPRAELSRRSMSTEQLNAWTSRMGLPPDALGPPTRLSDLAWTAKWQDAAGWRRLADPLDVVEIDLSEHRSAQIDVASSVQVNHSGTLNVALISAEIRLAPGIVLRTDRPEATNSWHAYVVGLEALQLKRGQQLRVRYRHGHPARRLEVGLE